MAHTLMRLYFRGKRLRTIRYTFLVLGERGTRTHAMLDCGHTVDVSDHTYRQVGQRTTCPVCR